MMKNLFKFGIFAVCFLMVGNVCFAQKTAKVDLGKLRSNTYTNDFFEIKTEFPSGWLVGDNALESQLVAIQQGSIQAKNAKNQKALNNAINRVTPLLGGYKALPGSSAENSNLRILVESLPATSKIKTSQTYLNALISTLKMTKLPPGYNISGIKSEMIDGKLINYLETSYLTIQKRMYVIVKKGFAIMFSIEAYNQKDFDELHKVFEMTDLDYKKSI